MAVPLVALDALLIALLALALALLIVAIMRSVAKVVGGIPVIGGKIASAAESIAQEITNALGKAFRGLDKLIGSAWHALARYFDTLWSQIETQAHLLAQFGNIVGNQLYNVTGLKSLVHRLEQVFHGIEHGVKTLTREYHGIDRRLHKLEQELARGIGHDVRVQVAGLEQEVTRLEDKVIPGIRAGVRTAEGEVTSLEEWVKANAVTEAGLVTEATVAALLAAGGLSWLRCNSNPFMNNRNACGLWGDLANLLAIAAIDAAALASIYELIGVAQKVTPTITQLASDVLKV